MISRETRVRQLLSTRAAAVSVFVASTDQLTRQLNRRVHPLFGIVDVWFLCNNVALAISCIDRLMSLVGIQAESDEDPVVTAVLTSKEGESAARQFLELHKELEAKNLSWTDEQALGCAQLDTVEPSPLTVHGRMMMNQFKSLSALAEAIHETLWSQLALYHLQFWTLQNNDFHFSGEINAAEYESEASEQGEVRIEAEEVTAARLKMPEAAITSDRRFSSTRASLRQLQRLHNAQFRLYRRTALEMQREFGKFQGSETFLPMVARTVELLDTQSSNCEKIAAAAATLKGEGNRSQALSDARASSSFYYYLTARRHLTEQIGDLDEWRKALACMADVMNGADTFKDTDPARYEAAIAISWRLLACQHQLHSLARLAEAISFTQDAIFRGYGLKFWQSARRTMRWEGDGR